MDKKNTYHEITPPLEFIRDIRDIISDGDGMEADALLVDVVGLINKYLEEKES